MATRAMATESLATVQAMDVAAYRDVKLKEVGHQTVIHHRNALSHL
jgi:hypothetical protein